MTDDDGAGPTTLAARRELIEGELFEKSSQLFAAKGFAGTTLQDIADAVGVSRPTLYHYIQSKDELLDRVVRDMTDMAAQLVDSVTTEIDDDPEDKLRRLIHAMVELVGNHPAQFRLLAQSESALPEELAARHRRNRHKVLDAVIDIVESGKKQARFRPVDSRTAALTIIGSWNSVASWYHRGDLGGIATEISELGVRSLLVPSHMAVDRPQQLIDLARDALDRLSATIDSSDTDT
jgi:AcrR family transcriptional regulator